MINILDGIFEQLRREQRKKEYFYVTDIGRCKRKIIMDFENLPKKPLTDSELLMFDDADVSHSNLSSRVRNIKGIAVIGEEMDISEGLPEMWHGRLDLLYFEIETKEFIIVDFKGTRSFKGSYEFPKANHVLQIQSYIYAVNNMGIPVNRGILFYKDRTGSNTPILCEIEPNPDIEKVFKEYEDVLEVYKATKILPEILPRELKKKKKMKYF